MQNFGMETPTRAPYGPLGDPTCHLSLVDLRTAYGQLAPAPTDHGTVTLLCQRLPDGTRNHPASAIVSHESGLHGDGWSRRPPRDPLCQLTVMNHAVAELIANTQSLGLFGDNLFVTLDLSSENLPIGSHIQVGTAIVELTPEPHNGCAKFHERFGADALRFVQDSRTRHRNLRGVHWRVIENGEIHQGSPVTVLHRGPRSADA